MYLFRGIGECAVVVVSFWGWTAGGGERRHQTSKAVLYKKGQSFSPSKRGGNLLLSLVKPLCDLDQEEANLLF